MSGHSKWATTKHQKAAKDKARSKLFAKLIRQIEVAAREGGGDLDANATLRTMVGKARAASVPTDTIDRAVKRGTGELEGVHYESVVYEGYAPCGVAVLVDVLTDNRNRASAEVRNVFTRMGGSMAEPGSVSWQFARRGVAFVARAATEDDVMMAALDAGADDVQDEGDAWRVTSEPGVVEVVRTSLAQAGLEVLSAEATMLPSTLVPLDRTEDAKKVLRLIEALEEHDDVQDVYANFDIPDAVLQSVDA
jgi:YebC/PmpR family DNA-binding regulatory protein